MPPERAAFLVTPERGDTLFAPEGRNAAPPARDLTASGGCGRLFMPGGHNTAPEGRGALCRGVRLCAAVRGAGALRMRHTPCGCCSPDFTAEYFDYLAGLSKFASASRFVHLKYAIAQTKPPGMIQEGGISPLLGRFKRDCKGGKSKSPLCRFLFTASGFFFAAQRKRG